MPDQIRIERKGAVTIITLDRPDKRNAMGRELRTALVSALAETEADSACRAVVVTGAGGHFSAGGDLGDMPSTEALSTHARMLAAQEMLLRIVGSAKPFVAAVEGVAYGAGLSLALACDHIVATPASRLCAPFVRVGLAPDVGLLWTLPRRVGVGRAQDMLLGAEPVDGAEALRIGLVDRLAAPGEALDEAVGRAEVFAKGAPAALAAVKSALRQPGASLAGILEFEAMTQTMLLGTADHAEGKAAFFERRPAAFRNA